MTWLRAQRAAKASPARSFGARGPFPVISATLSIRNIASATTCRRTWAHVCEACRTPPTRATATSTFMANALAAVCCLLRVPEISRGPLVQAGKSTVVSRRDPPPRSLPPRGSSATMDRVSRFFGNLPGLGGGAAPADAPLVDTAEKVQISSLALLKMLKHGTCMLKDPRTFVQVELVYPWK